MKFRLRAGANSDPDDAPAQGGPGDILDHEAGDRLLHETRRG